MKELKRMMRPELINRLDSIVVFKALTHNEVRDILDLQLKRLGKRLIRKHIAVVVSQSAKKWLLDKGYDALNGVRPLRRLIQDTIEDEIAAGLLDERYTKGSVIAVTTKAGELSYSLKAE